MQQEVYPRRWLLEDEEQARECSRSIRLIRSGPFFERNQKPPMEASWGKYIRNLNKKLGEEIQQKDKQLYRNASSKRRGEDTRRRSRAKDQKEKEIFLAGKRKQDRVQVQRSRWKKKHGKLSAL